MSRQATALFPTLDGSFAPVKVGCYLFPTVQAETPISFHRNFFVNSRKWHDLALSGLTKHLRYGSSALSIAADGGTGGALGRTSLLQKAIQDGQFSNAWAVACGYCPQ